MRPIFFFTFALALAFAALPRAARAQGAGPGSVHPHTYALLLGSNSGGAGQGALRFAEDDARRMASVLREVGHYADADVRVLLHPDAALALGAIAEIGAKVRARADAGEQSEVLFYYSGHARASALSLGSEDLPLKVLRERLSALPATLTIVVLDACQSGAFARVKGAERAADFTYNSVSRLTQTGLVVMASSSSQELSQESDELKGSYFTHHLVTALRGAGDTDHDGRVSLDEAYRYAYRRTLASTALTQVGEQHVTLETDLTGHDDVAVTYPAEAKAQLELPGPLEGRILVQHRGSGAVVAELQKVAGPPVRLAMIAGAYDAVVGQSGRVVECHFSLTDDQVTSLDPSACAEVVPDRTASKGEEREPEIREIDRWEIESATGLIWNQYDGYTQRLSEFGYQQQGSAWPTSARLTLGVSRILIPHIAGVLQFQTLTGDTYARNIEGSSDTASFNAYGAAFAVRAYTDVVGRWLGVYAQAGLGMSLGVLTYETVQTGVPPSTTSTYANYLLTAGAGMTFRFPRVATLYVEGGYDHAPVIQNLLGDTHDSGGPWCVLGMRFRFGGQQ
jgi:Caspase domain